jgi:hypothetical protein
MNRKWEELVTEAEKFRAFAAEMRPRGAKVRGPEKSAPPPAIVKRLLQHERELFKLADEINTARIELRSKGRQIPKKLDEAEDLVVYLLGIVVDSPACSVINEARELSDDCIRYALETDLLLHDSVRRITP